MTNTLKHHMGENPKPTPHGLPVRGAGDGFPQGFKSQTLMLVIMEGWGGVTTSLDIL